MNVIRILLLGAVTACASAPAPEATDPGEEIARRVLSTTPLVDGHNDLPWAIQEATGGDVAAYDLRGRTSGHTDIPRLRAGMVGGQFWSVYVPVDAVGEGAARMQLEQIDIARQVLARYPDIFAPVTTPDGLREAFRQGRIGSVLGLEGGHVLGNSLGVLRAFHALGARYLTLTHSRNTDWADASTDTPEHDGLTEFGREVVREMNRLGMLVDLSHVAVATMHDALDVSEAPVIFSHSSARAVTDVPRNVPDEILRRLPENGGVIMVSFVPDFVNAEVAAWEGRPRGAAAGPRPRAGLEDVVRHIEHVRDIAGIDHVGIGADFDGITTVPVGLEDVSTYPALFVELARRGWTEEELRKLAGENVLRAWERAEEVASRIRRERGPSTATIDQLDG